LHDGNAAACRKQQRECTRAQWRQLEHALPPQTVKRTTPPLSALIAYHTENTSPSINIRQGYKHVTTRYRR
jgi:hypothetical protein